MLSQPLLHWQSSHWSKDKHLRVPLCSRPLPIDGHIKRMRRSHEFAQDVTVYAFG